MEPILDINKHMGPRANVHKGTCIALVEMLTVNDLKSTKWEEIMAIARTRVRIMCRGCRVAIVCRHMMHGFLAHVRRRDVTMVKYLREVDIIPLDVYGY